MNDFGGVKTWKKSPIDPKKRKKRLFEKRGKYFMLNQISKVEIFYMYASVHEEPRHQSHKILELTLNYYEL